WLLQTYPRPLAGGVAEAGYDARAVHPAFEIGVAQGILDERVVRQVDADRRVRLDAPHQVLGQLFGQERHERRQQIRQGDQHIVQRAQRGWIRLVAGRPEARAAEADVPVAQVVEEVLDGARR